jgi:UDP-2,3-diacylglucosamine pyrophosphatase LpxH
VINGDFIDGWQFSTNYFPESHLNVLKEIMQMLTNGTQVYYLTGNHDDFLRRFPVLKLGNLMISDKAVITLSTGEKSWFFHGDVFDLTMKSSLFWAKLGAVGYGFLFFINKIINTVSKFLFQSDISISKRMLRNMNERIKLNSNFIEIVTKMAVSKNYRYVVCGHLHLPEIIHKVEAGKNVTYLNSGDWTDHCSFLEFNLGDWKLNFYHQNLPVFSKDEVNQINIKQLKELIPHLAFLNYNAK